MQTSKPPSAACAAKIPQYLKPAVPCEWCDVTDDEGSVHLGLEFPNGSASCIELVTPSPAAQARIDAAAAATAAQAVRAARLLELRAKAVAATITAAERDEATDLLLQNP